MAKMKIDWNKLLLEKGERIGLGVALFFGGLFMLFGLISIVTSGSASANAEVLKGLTTDISRKQATAQPTEADLPGKAAETKEYVALTPINPMDYRTDSLFYSPRDTDTKKRNPSILTPDEFKVQAVLAQLRSYDLVIDRNTGKPVKVSLLEGGAGGMGGGPGTPGGKIGDQKDYRNRLGGTQGYGKGSGGMGPGTPPMPGGGEGPYGDGRFQYSGGGAQPASSGTVKLVNVSDLDKYSNATFAEKVWAKPMIMIAGTFPYKAQVEEFRRQLRARSNYEVLNGTNTYAGTQKTQAPPLFKFEGVVLERITLAPDGTPARLPNGKQSDWAEVPLERYFKEVAMVTGRRFEPEDTELPPLLYQISDELMMGLPLQFHENRYPKLFSKLDNIKKTVAEIKKNDAKNFISPKKSAFDDGDFKSFGSGASSQTGMGSGGPIGPGGPMPPMGGPGQTGPYGPGGEMGMGGQVEAMIPEHCMFRIVDTDPRLEPGKTYKYRIRVRMANPNYTPDETQRKARKDAYPQEAEVQYLVSAPVEIPETATLPADLHFYAVDQKEVDGPTKYVKDFKGRNAIETAERNKKVMIQVHRWLDVYYPDLKVTRNARTVGDWSVAERMGVYRGEFVKRDIMVEVPEKPLDQGDFVLATNPRASKADKDKTLIAVTFGDESVLVDFEESDRNYRRLEIPAQGNSPAKYRTISDKAATEILIYTPDGRMIARNSVEDKEDPERIKRLDDWRQLIEALRGSKPSGGGAFGPGSQP